MAVRVRRWGTHKHILVNIYGKPSHQVFAFIALFALAPYMIAREFYIDYFTIINEYVHDSSSNAFTSQ